MSEFQWTDELVYDLMNSLWSDKFDKEAFMQEVSFFKKSKNISSEWIVISFKSSLGHIASLQHDTNTYKYERLPNDGWRFDVMVKHHAIHSVKRLSDESVFAIGDVFQTKNGKIDTIKKFVYSDWSNNITVFGDTCERYLSDIKHEKAVPLTKPPLGLRPHYISRQERLDEIYSAMSRYDDAGKCIPEEWVNEKNKLEYEKIEEGRKLHGYQLLSIDDVKKHMSTPYFIQSLERIIKTRLNEIPTTTNAPTTC